MGRHLWLSIKKDGHVIRRWVQSRPGNKFLVVEGLSAEDLAQCDRHLSFLSGMLARYTQRVEAIVLSCLIGLFLYGLVTNSLLGMILLIFPQYAPEFYAQVACIPVPVKSL